MAEKPAADSEMLREVHPGDLTPLEQADFFDPVIAAYKKDVDRTLLRENLELTPQQRSERFLEVIKSVYELRGKANAGLKVWR